MTGRSSLRLRLLGLGAVSVLVALLVAGVVIFYAFSAAIEAERRDDLQASLDRLTASIDPDAGRLAGSSPLVDPRYDTPFSGMYWQIRDLDTGAILRSRSLWDQELPSSTVSAGEAELSETSGPNDSRLIVLSRYVAADGVKGQRHLNVAVAEARSQDDDPIQRFGSDLLLALVVLAVVLMTAAATQVHFGLRPLGVLQGQIARIRLGTASRLPSASAAELVPVVDQVNELLEGQEATIAFARQRAADLAHGLKTPLAVLSATSERLRQQGNFADADLLEMLASQMNSRIDYQLRLARLRYRTRAQGASSSFNEAVLRSVAVLRKGPNAEKLSWGLDLQEALSADIDEHDLMELTGIVLDNASKWAKSRVLVKGVRLAKMIELHVEDDGKGLSDEMTSRLGSRGARLDESMPGEGIGLAIAMEVVRLNRGSIKIDRSHIGGLRVRIVLPAADEIVV